MPIFEKSGEVSGEMETIIGSSVKVEGNFKSGGNVTVNGVVQGSIKTSRDLKVGKNAKIKAEVVANNLFLQGEIRGNVSIKEKAQLTSSSKILGNIETKILSVEEGAIINGKCTMLQEQVVEEVKSDSKKTEK